MRVAHGVARSHVAHLVNQVTLPHGAHGAMPRAQCTWSMESDYPHVVHGVIRSHVTHGVTHLHVAHGVTHPHVARGGTHPHGAHGVTHSGVVHGGTHPHMARGINHPHVAGGGTHPHVERPSTCGTCSNSSSVAHGVTHCEPELGIQSDSSMQCVPECGT